MTVKKFVKDFEQYFNDNLIGKSDNCIITKIEIKNNSNNTLIYFWINDLQLGPYEAIGLLENYKNNTIAATAESINNQITKLYNYSHPSKKTKPKAKPKKVETEIVTKEKDEDLAKKIAMTEIIIRSILNQPTELNKQQVAILTEWLTLLTKTPQIKLDAYEFGEDDDIDDFINQFMTLDFDVYRYTLDIALSNSHITLPKHIIPYISKDLFGSLWETALKNTYVLTNVELKLIYEKGTDIHAFNEEHEPLINIPTNVFEFTDLTHSVIGFYYILLEYYYKLCKKFKVSTLYLLPYGQHKCLLFSGNKRDKTKIIEFIKKFTFKENPNLYKFDIETGQLSRP